MKATWVVIGLTAITVLGQQFESLRFLTIPYIVLLVGTLPAMAAAGTSAHFASAYIRLHKLIIRGKNSSYYFNSQYSSSDLRPLKFVGMTVIHSIAMTYLIARIANFFLPDRNLPNDAIFLMITMWMCSWYAFALTFASWLLTKSGTMFENTKDGTRINLGVDMQNKLKGAIGYQSAASLIMVIGTDPMNTSPLMILGMTIAFITIPSSLFSIYFIKKKHWRRLLNNLVKKLVKIV